MLWITPNDPAVAGVLLIISLSLNFTDFESDVAAAVVIGVEFDENVERHERQFRRCCGGCEVGGGCCWGDDVEAEDGDEDGELLLLLLLLLIKLIWLPDDKLGF